MFGATLCLLAAAFAVEAKLGWYSPDGNVRVHFSSTKFQVDANRQSVNALVAPASAPHFPQALPQFLAISAFLPAIIIPGLAEVLSTATRFLFSPPHFFRPPPHA
jgi:hypothetical protein